MKKIWKYILVLMIANMMKNSNCVGQVNLETTYLTRTSGWGQEFFLTNLGDNDYKYVIYDYDSSKFSLYNLNHTPYMLNIQTPFVVTDTFANAFYRLGYITKTLFDCDSTNIEYALMLDSPKPTLHPNFAIYRTNGTLLFSKDTVGTEFCVGCGSGSYEVHPIMNTPAGAKLYLFNGNVSGYLQHFVYSLCGSLPESITEINQSNSFVKVFPNPTSNRINFEITALSHSEDYELTIFNSAFQTIKIISINGKTEMNLDCEFLSSGTYFYSLQNKNKVYQTGKFVLSK